MSNSVYIAAIFLPLLASLIVGLFGRTLGVRASNVVSVGAIFGAAACSVLIFIEIALGHQVKVLPLMTWIASGDFVVEWALRFDTLSAVMLVVVTGVSAMVHLYSVGYMSHDASRQRFMSYLGLFTFTMLMLVTANNLVQLFFGWEGVGLASYLLIGFWHDRDSANAASIKAFVVNRVGDLGLALGVFAAFFVFGTVSFEGMFAQAPQKMGTMLTFWGYSVPALELVCLLLFVGAVGKSAQLGLHTWLPDAMEGPTPVSALIHAATMVTAGVFLMCRMSPVLEFAPLAGIVITFVGAATAVFAATVGLTQFDIKRVIAYSTCSQLGYMMFAIGISAYPAAIFHLFTHAFFKALLFLGAGSVIHGMHDEQDMRKMGGLRKALPITHLLMFIGSLALAGIPPFAGYYSKDMILELARAKGTYFAHFAMVAGLIVVFLTAFYSWRVLCLAFYGKTRADKHTFEHAHESPFVMLLPMLILTVGAIGAGYLGKEYFIGHDRLTFWNNSLFVLPANDVVDAAHHLPEIEKKVPLVLALAGIIFSYLFYLVFPKVPAFFTKVFRFTYTFFYRKWFFDELYTLVFVRGAKALGRGFWRIFDTKIIDRFLPNGAATVSWFTAGGLSKLQSGFVAQYATVMLLGLVAFLSYFLFKTVLPL